MRGKRGNRPASSHNMVLLFTTPDTDTQTHRLCASLIFDRARGDHWGLDPCGRGVRPPNRSPLAALAGKVHVAVAGKFPIIPKGYRGLVE